MWLDTDFCVGGVGLCGVGTELAEAVTWCGAGEGGETGGHVKGVVHVGDVVEFKFYWEEV